MLKTRVLTAVVLLGLFLSAIYLFSPVGWIGFVTLVATLAAWEWGALLGLGRGARFVLGGGFAVLCLAIFAWQPAALGVTEGFSAASWSVALWLYGPAILFWAVVVPLWMRQRWVLPKSMLGVLVGLIVVLPAWLALIQLRQIGNTALLAIMATVWIADSAAYFSGRALGRHKLAPSISPGKTWEGAIGGAAAVVLYGLVLAKWLPAALSGNLLVLTIVLVMLTVISVVGDLFESLLKRQAGLKDSSQILPGHGGVLDRIDSLTSTLPFVALVWLMSLR